MRGKKKWRVFVYDTYKQDGQFMVNNQFDVGEVELNDGRSIKRLKKELKRIFGIKPYVRLGSLQIDGDSSIIILDYVTRKEWIPVGHLELIEDV
jgi:hypothetical protein